MLEVRRLSKSFRQLQAACNLSLTLAAGERLVILGPNGAGKTTLFNLLTGELRPSAGDILVEGVSIARLGVAARARMGLARSYQKNTLFEGLTVRENLMLAASAGMRKTGWLLKDSFRDPAVRAQAEAVAAQVALLSHLDAMVRALSYGARRQLELGLALATDPRILLMDEPTSGIGPAMIEGFHRMIMDLPRALTLVIIEHDLDLAFAVADRITVLNYGEIIFEGTPEETRGNKIVRDIYLGDWQADA